MSVGNLQGRIVIVQGDAHEHQRQRREAAVAALAVDRARYLGDAGLAIERRLAPLTGRAQASKDRCDELVRAAKADDSVSAYDVLRRLAALPEAKAVEGGW